jgi:AcrR family transcriptional regulator
MTTATTPLGSTPQPATRDEILDAAERRFADAGFAGTSMRDIARDAGLRNQASLYHYFEHKQELYEAVLGRAVDTLVPLWGDDVSGDGTAADGKSVSNGIDVVVDVLAARPHLARLIQRAGLEDDADVRATVSRLLRPLFDAGVRALEEAGGPWQRPELEHVAAGLYHLIFGYFANQELLAAVMRQDPATPAMVARQRRFLGMAVERLLGEQVKSEQVGRLEA